MNRVELNVKAADLRSKTDRAKMDKLIRQGRHQILTIETLDNNYRLERFKGLTKAAFSKTSSIVEIRMNLELTKKECLAFNVAWRNNGILRRLHFDKGVETAEDEVVLFQKLGDNQKLTHLTTHNFRFPEVADYPLFNFLQAEKNNNLCYTLSANIDDSLSRCLRVCLGHTSVVSRLSFYAVGDDWLNKFPILSPGNLKLQHLEISDQFDGVPNVQSLKEKVKDKYPDLVTIVANGKQVYTKQTLLDSVESDILSNLLRQEKEIPVEHLTIFLTGRKSKPVRDYIINQSHGDASNFVIEDGMCNLVFKRNDDSFLFESCPKSKLPFGNALKSVVVSESACQTQTNQEEIQFEDNNLKTEVEKAMKGLASVKSFKINEPKSSLHVKLIDVYRPCVSIYKFWSYKKGAVLFCQSLKHYVTKFRNHIIPPVKDILYRLNSGKLIFCVYSSKACLAFLKKKGIDTKNIQQLYEKIISSLRLAFAQEVDKIKTIRGIPVLTVVSEVSGTAPLTPVVNERKDSKESILTKLGDDKGLQMIEEAILDLKEEKECVISQNIPIAWILALSILKQRIYAPFSRVASILRKFGCRSNPQNFINYFEGCSELLVFPENSGVVFGFQMMIQGIEPFLTTYKITGKDNFPVNITAEENLRYIRWNNYIATANEVRNLFGLKCFVYRNQRHHDLVPTEHEQFKEGLFHFCIMHKVIQPFNDLYFLLNIEHNTEEGKTISPHKTFHSLESQHDRQVNCFNFYPERLFSNCVWPQLKHFFLIFFRESHELDVSEILIKNYSVSAFSSYASYRLSSDNNQFLLETDDEKFDDHFLSSTLGDLKKYFDNKVNFQIGRNPSSDFIEQNNGAYKEKLLSLKPRQNKQIFKWHCFLSHCWGEKGVTHELVLNIAQRLKNEKLKPWVDQEQMKGELDKDMSNGIEKSACFIVFITKAYMEKADDTKNNVGKEFSYATRTMFENIIVVVLDENCRDPSKWKNVVGFNLGGKLYIDFSSEVLINKNILTLCERIKEFGRVQTVEI